MSHALVIDGTIVAVGRLPEAARTTTDGRWVKVREGTVAEQMECGWFAVVEADQPADTASTTHARNVELVQGVPTVVWTERPKTEGEMAGEAKAAQEAEARFVLTQAVPTLRQWADQAESTTATSGNAVSVLNTTLDRLAVFFDRFADLLEMQYGDTP